MPLTLKSQVSRVLHLLERGECVQAASISCRILVSYPLCVVAYSLIARAYLGLGKVDTAQHLFERILSADPENADAYLGLGMILRNRESDKAALECLLRAYELAPGDLQIRQVLNETYHNNQSVTADVCPMSCAGLARAFLRGNLLEQAIDELGVLLQRLPQRTDLWVALCEAYWLNQEYTRSASMAQYVLGFAPFCLKANLILGQIWLSNKREDDARSCLERAQALDPENRWAQVVLGRYSSLPPRAAFLNWGDDLDKEPQPDYLKNIDGEELLPD